MFSQAPAKGMCLEYGQESDEPNSGQDQAVTTDRFVAHVSTVPATRGQSVGLFLREKVLPSTLESDKRPHVVLMVHGGFAPATVAYDLAYRDYSFMAALAARGFDVFALSHTGYAPSPATADGRPVQCRR
jgi:alpha-beta hydrolase superfamily lysophospholipase